MFKWIKFSNEKPKKSGLYFVKCYREIEVAWFDSVINKFLFFEFDYSVAVNIGVPNNLEWARMPRYSRSKLLSDGTIRL